jgi:ribosomal protein S17E
VQHLKESNLPTILVIACGALSQELSYLKKINSWTNITIQCLSAELHNTPKLIPIKVKEKLDLMADDFDKVYLAYADCGTGGLLDSLLKNYNIERLPGAHCYEFFAGTNQFLSLTEEELGTFYLTDFLVKHFNRLVIKGLGMDRYPELKNEYFKNYKKLTYLAQTDSKELKNKAKQYADFLNLEYNFYYTGLNQFRVDIEKGIKA